MTAPNLDDFCSQHFRYRDLIECGETWRKHVEVKATIDNVPKDPRTWEALRTISTEVLDPVVRTLGTPILTYGLSCAPLVRKIKRGVAPTLDQHGSYETTRTGTRLCRRDGIAVDFYVPGVTASTVAEFVQNHTPFDRLYFYGDDRPLHVSVGPECSRLSYRLTTGAEGRRMPRAW